MSGDGLGFGELRRAFPPRRRRVNLLVVAFRWRLELTGAALLWACLSLLGGPAALTIVGLLGSLAALAATGLVPRSRAILVRLVQRVIVSHRVRTGCVHAGLLAPNGRLPWIMRTRSGPRDVVVVRLWLPAGLAAEDVRAARHLLASACGALDVVVLLDAPRRDIVTLVVIRPRWAMPTW